MLPRPKHLDTIGTAAFLFLCRERKRLEVCVCIGTKDTFRKSIIVGTQYHEVNAQVFTNTPYGLRSDTDLMPPFTSGGTMPSIGVTGRWSGFATAVTQYCNAEDMKHLARVCRRDLMTTRAIWDMSSHHFQETVQMPQGSTGRTVGDVLRLQCDPGPWYAYAQSRAFTLLHSWCTQYVSLRRSVMFGIGEFVDCGYHVNEAYVGVDLNWANLGRRLLLANRAEGGRQNIMCEFPWQQIWDRAKAAACLGPQHFWDNDAKEVPITPTQASHFFLHWLIEMAPALTFVWSDHQAGLTSISEVWFALDLAPVIPLQGSEFQLGDDFFQVKMRNKYADRVTFQWV